MRKRNVLRLMWQKPLTTKDFHVQREVSFLELFYDLIYVVLIAQIAHHFTHHLDLTGLWQFVLLMGVILWTWYNGMLYHSLHGTNDISIRVFTFTQMILTGAMAIFAGEVFSNTLAANSFGALFGLFTMFLSILWFRTGLHDKQHRPGAYPFSLGYLVLGLAILLAGVFSWPYQFALWAGVVAFGLLSPFVMRFIPSFGEVLRVSNRQNNATIERFGLITLIALGESVVSAINGVAEFHPITLRVSLLGVSGMFIAIAIWWLYFDFVSRRFPWDGYLNNTLYTFIHFPLIMSITSIGAVLREMIIHNEAGLEPTVRWFFVGSVAVMLICSSILVQLVKYSQEIEPFSNRVSMAFVLVALIMLGIGLTGLGFLSVLGLSIMLLMIPVALGITLWVSLQLQNQE